MCMCIVWYGAETRGEDSLELESELWATWHGWWELTLQEQWEYFTTAPPLQPQPVDILAKATPRNVLVLFSVLCSNSINIRINPGIVAVLLPLADKKLDRQLLPKVTYLVAEPGAWLRASSSHHPFNNGRSITKCSFPARNCWYFLECFGLTHLVQEVWESGEWECVDIPVM